MFRLLACLLCLAAAAARADAPADVPADVPIVATDIAPVHALAARVMQGAGDPALILPQDASPHGFALRPSQAQALQRADLVIWIGPALTPWLGDALATLAPDAQRLTLMQLPGTQLLALRDSATFADDHDHDHDHAGQGTDPHAWLDPDNAILWLGAIAEALAQRDPENAALYRANAAAAQAELRTLTDQIGAQLSALGAPRYIVAHDALQYFEARFDLHAAGAVSGSDAAAPGAARLADLRRHMQDRAITCVLAEPGDNPDRLRAIFGADLRLVVVDPLGRLQPPGPALYPGLLRSLADGIADCAAP